MSDLDLFIHADNPIGEHRFTYVRLKDKTVTAFAVFVMVEPIDGKPCFAVGYAVPEAYRNQGRAKEIVVAALTDMQQGLLRNDIPEFYLEVIVGTDNPASQRIAEATISDQPEAVTESLTGLPAFRYVRKVEQAGS
jgi:RimJ/RimL family protein N-acetyltransferase